MRKIISFITLFFILIIMDKTVYANIDISAKSAIVMDASSKRVLFEKDAYTKRGMASTTKIMTGLISIEKLNVNEIVVVSPHAAGVEGSSIWLEPMEKISVNDLLYGLLLASGNDAATALAEHAYGSEDAFVTHMNRRAKLMGAYNTNFTNPHGLPDENHYTTAYDLALISACAMENSLFAEIVATKNKTISWESSQWDRSLSNHNKLLKRYEYATGIKTGYTKKDGRCLVSSAEKDGGRLICVTLSAPDDWNDHINMAEYCFDKYKLHTLFSEEESAGVFVNKEEEADPIGLLYEESYSTYLTDYEKDNITLKKSFNVNYPVTKGQIIGKCQILYMGEQIGSVNLIASNDSVIRKRFLTIIKKLAKGIVTL